MNRTGIVIMVSVLFLSVHSFSQYEDKPLENNKIYYNSGGIDYRFIGSNSVDFGLTYRRYFKESRYNLKASFHFGGNNELLRDDEILIYPTSDSTQIGVFSNSGYSSNHQRLEIGLEKKLKYKKINAVVGVDVLVGHNSLYGSDRVVEAFEEEIEKNGFAYKQYSPSSNNFAVGDNINFLQTSRNYLIFGARVNVGILVDITPRLYTSAFIGFKFAGDLLLKEDFYYKNDSYKDHLPISQSISTFNYDQNISLGLHYRF